MKSLLKLFYVIRAIVLIISLLFYILYVLIFLYNKEELEELT